MTINWFPGHMHKARKLIKNYIASVDVVFEVLDARIPYSSENPLVSSLTKNKSCIKILSKSDLSDPKINQLWQAYLVKKYRSQAVLCDKNKPNSIRNLIHIAKKLCSRDLTVKPLQIMILGIPNVGKSTIINVLSNKVIAKTGNIPAVTRDQQRIRLTKDVWLVDTPGFLWPKLEPKFCAYRLAVSGAIKDAVLDIEDVAFYIAKFFFKHYLNQVIDAFDLCEYPTDEIEMMDIIAKRRNYLTRGSIVNIRKVSEVLIHEYRSGKIGQISLETPEMIENLELEQNL